MVSSQAEFEQAFTSRIICEYENLCCSICSTNIYATAHARAFYGPNYHKDSEFDVITSTTLTNVRGQDITGYVAWVIVYPGQTASENAEWTNVLRTESKTNVNETYAALLGNLRGSMAQFTG